MSAVLDAPEQAQEDADEAPAPRPVDFLVAAARTNFAAFVSAVHRPRFKHSAFSAKVCRAVDQFVLDVIAGKRPILMLTAPPQHGKSSLISRCLPPYLFGRLTGELPAVRIACASYADTLAQRNRRDAQAIMHEPIYREIFPKVSMIGFKGIDNAKDGLQVPEGGALKALGVKGSLTGFSVDVGLIDDLIKDAEEALSEVIQERNVSFYDSVFTTRLQERSGQVLIGTPWSSNDILAHVRKKYGSDPRFTLLSFPALNYPDEIGFDPELPRGALVPHLHSETKLREMKTYMALLWWSAMFQQRPLADVGAIFKRQYLQHYKRADLAGVKFVQKIMSVDATFKDGKKSDYVAVGVWGKTVDNRVYLLAMRREQLGFVKTAQAIVDLRTAYPDVHRIYVEEAANGAAIIDMLKKHYPQIVGVPPLGSKEARWHAVSWAWDAGMIFLPDPSEVPGIAPWVEEITSVPDAPNDDTADCMAIALQQLLLRTPIAAMITNEILHKSKS